MAECAKYLGRGLLVLALTGAVFACGDDDDGDGAGDDAGAADGGEAGSGGSGTDAGITDRCADAVEDANASVPAACVECLCDEDPEATSECDEQCWTLIACVQRECEGNSRATDCIVAACAAEAGGIANLMEIGMVADAVPLDECSAECPAATGDGGTEADAGD